MSENQHLLEKEQHILSEEDSKVEIPAVSLLNNFVRRITMTTAWLNALLIVIILIQVSLRYGVKSSFEPISQFVGYINSMAAGLGFRSLLVPLEEFIWHVYALAFMFGLSYAVTTDSHIRVDIIHHTLEIKTQRIIEVIGIVFLMMPFIVILFDHSLAWTQYAYNIAEGSENPTGLPYRWVVKSVIPMSMVLLFISALARLIHNVVMLACGEPKDNSNLTSKSKLHSWFTPKFNQQ